MGLEDLPELGHMHAWGISHPDEHVSKPYREFHENYAHIAEIEYKSGGKTVCYVYGKVTSEEFKNYARGYTDVRSPVKIEIVTALFVRYVLSADGKYGHGEDENVGERIEYDWIKSYKVLRKGHYPLKKVSKKKSDKKEGIKK